MRFGHTVLLQLCRRPRNCSLLVMQMLLCQSLVDFSINRAHQLTDTEESWAGRWRCVGNPKSPKLWVNSHTCPMQGTRCSLFIPVHHTTLYNLLQEVSWGTKGNEESQPVPRANMRVESYMVLLLSRSKTWGCAEVGHDVSKGYTASVMQIRTWPLSPVLDI